MMVDGFLFPICFGNELMDGTHLVLPLLPVSGSRVVNLELYLSGAFGCPGS